jgi:CubicO group peptidase (beta-lactamase class C family)
MEFSFSMVRFLLGAIPPARTALASSAFIILSAAGCGSEPEPDPRWEDLRSSLDAMRSAGAFNGAALVAEGDEVVFFHTAGMENAGTGETVDRETRFRIASLTKQFTAAAVLMLAEDGLIDLDAPAAVYLPELDARPSENVTARQLLSHTAGIPNEWRVPESPDSRDNPEAYVSAFADMPLDFAPGSDFSYSNSGYYILGLMIERVTNLPYGEALEELIFRPLGLGDTGTIASGESMQDLAQGYVIRDGEYVGSDPYEDGHPYAAGMMVSTPADLHRWARLLHRGRVFENESTLEEMVRPRMPAYDAPGFGRAEAAYGLFRVTAPGTGRWWMHHDGRHGPFVADMRYYPSLDIFTVVLDNADGDIAASAKAVNAAAFGDLPAQGG